MMKRTMERLAAYALALVLLLSLLPAGALSAAATDGEIRTAAVGGEVETERGRDPGDDGTFLIHDYEELLAFAQAVEEDPWADNNYHAVLMANIDASASREQSWTPICSDGIPFDGVFDGNGHVIRNLVCVADEYVGLFGSIGLFGTVKNVGLESCSFNGGDGETVGSLAGENLGTIECCFSNSSVTGGTEVGGLVGRNCGTVRKCCALGTVTARNDFAGGLVGEMIEGATLERCFCSCVVILLQSAGAAGALIGYYDGGSVNSLYWDYRACDMGAVGDTDPTHSFPSGAVEALETSSMIGPDALQTMTGLGDGWCTTEDGFPYPEVFQPKIVYHFDADDIDGTCETFPAIVDYTLNAYTDYFNPDGLGFFGWTTSPDGTGDYYDDQAAVTLGMTEQLDLYARWLYTDEEGTYYITSNEDWNTLATWSLYHNDPYTFIQTADLENVTTRIAPDSKKPFTGTYDGWGYAIEVDYYERNTECVAPFSYISGATIRGVKTEGSVEGGKHCAGLVGHTVGGTNTITDCAVGTIVHGASDYCGGILGHGGTCETDISGCVFFGEIGAAANNGLSGGLVGWGDNMTIRLTDCLDISPTLDVPVGAGAGTVTLTNCYYRGYKPPCADESHRWSDMGKEAYRVCFRSNIDAALAGELLEYECTGLFSSDASSGLYYDGDVYAAAGESVALSLTYTGDWEACRYVVDAYATIDGEGGAYSLRIGTPDEPPVLPDIHISAEEVILPGVRYWDPIEGKMKRQEEYERFGETLSDGVWYVLNDPDPVNYSYRVTVNGNVNLILCDGCLATFNAGFSVPEGSKLTIWAQSVGDNMGKLSCDSKLVGNCAVLGGEANAAAGDITINGGLIGVTYNELSASGGAAIGGGAGSAGGSVTINGGKVSADGAGYGAAIGAGSGSSGFRVTVNGGEIEASAANYGAAIGAGKEAFDCSVTINGGEIGASAAYSGAAIGFGQDAHGNIITINGGKVTATGDHDSPGIGTMDPYGENTVVITGGTVTVTAGLCSAAIGGGYQCAGGCVTIRGGTVGVYSETGCHIGGGKNGSGGLCDHGKLNLLGMKLTVSGETYTAEERDALCRDLVGDMLYLTVCDSHRDNNADGLCDYCALPLGSITYYDPMDAEAPTKICENPVIYRGETTLKNDTWYVVAPGDFYVMQRVYAGNNTNLLLMDGAKLYACRGIEVDDGSSLTIWAQKESGDDLGALSCDMTKATGYAENFGAAIGGGDGRNGGCICINGGNIYAAATGCAAGIGGGRYAKNGDVTIISGNVVAIGNRGAGIGGGYQGDDTNTDVSGGSVYIYGGRVNATGGENAAGIGGGGAPEDNEVNEGCSGGYVIISAGTVVAIAGEGGGAAIGRGARGGILYFLAIGEGLQVSGGDDYQDTQTADMAGSRFEREDFCAFHPYVRIEPCYEHDFTCTAEDDCNGETHTCTCRWCWAYGETKNHSLTIESDSDEEHKISCSVCGYCDFEPHDFDYTDNKDGTHTVTCSDCDYAQDSVPHVFVNHVCVCGATEPAVSVLFYANDGSGASVTQDVPVGEATALQANGFTRRGWSFAGWNTVETPTEANPGTAYTDKQTVTLNGDLTLYARWTPNGIAADALTGTYTYNGAAQTPAVTVRDAVTNDVLTLDKDYEITYTNNTNVTENGAAFTVTGKGDYAGAEAKGGFMIQPKTVTVKAQSKQFTYNGTAQSWNKYDVSGLVGSDKITAVVTGSITFPDEGSVTNKVESCEFTSGAASNYKVTRKDGVLTMVNASANITITAASQSWTYDGNAHSNGTVTVTSGKLFPGDALVAEATGSVKDVSMLTVCNNVVADGYKIEHDGKDVTDNYVITAVDGMLSILPKEASVTADNKSKTVGETDPKLTATVKGVVAGETLNYTLSRQTGEEAGEYPITVKLGENPNYKIMTKSGTFTIRPLCADGHTLEKTEANDPTCTKPGNSEYYTCAVCGAYFSDEDAQHQIEKDSWVIPATGHKYGEPEWSWRRDYSAAEATFTCAACGDKQTIKATVVALTVEPTCTLPGKITYTAFVEFLEGKYEDSKEIIIQPRGHSYGAPEWSWKYDLTEAEATFTCSVCGDGQTVKATIESKTVDPTCTEEGKLFCVATVDFLEKTYQDEQTGVIPATGHTYGEPEWSWKEDGSAAEATFACLYGDDKQTVKATITTETTKPTCTEDGKIVCTATVTFRRETFQSEKVIVLPATGHSYGAPEWNWADDFSAADAIFVCAACGDKQTLKATIIAETTEPSCTKDGKTVYAAVVDFLDDYYKSEQEQILPAKGHTAGDPVKENETEPTCTVDGGFDTVTYCTVCGEELSREATVLPATGHTYGEPDWKWADDFSAADAVFTCAACGDEQTVKATIAAETTDPTCTAAGKIVCTATAVFRETAYASEQTQSVAPLGHTPGTPQTENETAATCTEDGKYDAVVYCAVCGAELSRETVTVPAAGHDWGDWIVVTEPTEDEAGEEIRYCKNDPTHTETRPIPPLSHVHSLQHFEAIEATCTDGGSAEYYACTGCGRFYADADAKLEIEENSWILPPLGHLFGAGALTAAVAPTCAEAGNAAYYTCERCGKFFADPDGAKELTAEETVVPATGHDWGEWTVSKAPTDDEAGEEIRYCKNDPTHFETRAIPPLSHVHDLSYTEAVPATCTESGTVGYYACAACGKRFADADAAQELNEEDLIVPALGHDWGDWEVVTAADEYRAGEERRVCRNDASHAETRPIGQLPHDDCPSAKFTDADRSAWYHENLDYVLRSGFMQGVADAKFDPDGTVTRATVVTILYRIEGEPDAPKSPFKDVAAGSWYEAAVNWAASTGVTLGVSKTEFAPDAPVTREQMVAFFYRYAKYKGCDVTASGTLENFTDANKVSAWATDAMLWAKEKALVNGMTEELLLPGAIGTRSQLCAVIHRFCINILGLPSYAETAENAHDE